VNHPIESERADDGGQGSDPTLVAGPISSTQPAMRLPSPQPETQGRALGVLAILAVVGLFWVVRSVAIGILLGMLNAFIMQPLYERMRARGQRSALAAAIVVVLSTAAIALALVLLGYLFVARGIALASTVMASLAPGSAARTQFDDLVHRVAPDGGQDLLTRARDAAAGLAERAATIGAAVASATFSILLGVFFALLTTHFVLRHWSTITRRLEDMLPLHPRHTRALLEEFRGVGRAALLGTVVTGLAQGVLAGVGYLLSGLPEPAFFGAATAVASLIPAVGTLLVWVPAGVYLLVAHHVGGGVVCLVWGALVVVGVSDYVIRPKLVGSGGEMPALLTFAALFGGVESLGLSGLIIGPLVTATAVATLRIYAIETKGRRVHTPPPDADRESHPPASSARPRGP
jgi:predicted PurR-regulated permease PerM